MEQLQATQHHKVSDWYYTKINGAISFVSPAFVGSISDPKLTRSSGLISKLQGKDNISVMADRGFTIQDQLKSIGVGLNIPPFLDGKEQLTAN